MNFVAIDFETANSQRSSICSIGLAVVENDKIVDTQHILVKPVPNYYDAYNSFLHGITENDTRNKKTFKKLWKDLKPYFQNKIIVAHNASFDCSVLRYTLDAVNLEYPDLEYYCTWKLSQMTLNMANCGLYQVAKYFKIKLEHHNAESDAKACAHIGLKLCEINKVTDLEKLSNKFGFNPGKIISYPKSYLRFSKSKGNRGNISVRAFYDSVEELRKQYLAKLITQSQYIENYKKLREVFSINHDPDKYGLIIRYK